MDDLRRRPIHCPADQTHVVVRTDEPVDLSRVMAAIGLAAFQHDGEGPANG
jgi:hypothetical protein